jgi:uncharacterized repeat protein (TIGR01451 family)
MQNPQRRFLPALAIVLLLTSSLMSLLASPAAALGERACDANTVVGGGDPFFLVYANQSVAQSFTSSASYVLLNLTLRLRNAGGAGNTANITIRPDAGGVPSGAVFAWANPQAGAAVGPVNVPLTPTPTLTKGVTYWIVATKGGAAAIGYEWHHSGANRYPGGKAMINTGAGWTNPGTPTDMWFLTYGRGLNTNMTIVMTASGSMALPKDTVVFTLFFNNTGQLSATTAWINDTLPAGLAYVSDTANLVPSVTGFPNYSFANLANGVHSFMITTTVNTNAIPGSVLTNRATLVYTNATGVLGPKTTASASMIIGLQGKQLYLLPTSVATQRLVPTPPPNGATQVVYRIRRNPSSVDFQLASPLARTLRVMNVTVVLFLDSASHSARSLDMNFTLIDVNGSGQTPVAYQQLRVTTDNVNGFQQFTYPFPRIDVNFTATDQVLLRITNMDTSWDDALLAVNATATPSQMDVLTPTYVHVDSMQLRDAKGVTTLWSPKDLLNVTANVSDPLGNSEITAAWVNLTNPSGAQVLSFVPMSSGPSDPSALRAWKVYSRTYGPTLVNGTYAVEVIVEEANGVLAYATVTVLVRAPSLTLNLVPTQSSALSGDMYFYVVWYNNTGSGLAGQLWINATLPAQVLFATSSAEPNRTGPTRWIFSNVTPGTHLLIIEVQVRFGIPPAPSMTATVGLNYSDEKGYLWPSRLASAGVVLDGPVVGLTLTSSTPTIHPNETFVLGITLRNTGDLAGTLWLNLTLPSALAYVSDTSTSFGGSATRVPNGLDMRFANMSASASWTINVTVRSGPGLSRGTNLTASVDLNDTNARGAIMPARAAASTIRVIAPAIVNASLRFGRTLATPGDVIPAYLNFTNAGDEAAPSLAVTLTLDPSLSFVNASVTATVSGRAVLFLMTSVGLMTERIFLNLSVSRTATDADALVVPGFLVYTDRLGNHLPLVALAGSSVTVATPVVTLTASPGSPTVEAGMTYLTHVVPGNTGSGVAKDVWLNVTLPTALVYVSDTSDGQRTVIGSRLSWHWQNLPTGPKPFDLALLVRPTAADASNASVSLVLQYTDANGNRGPERSLTLKPSFVAPTIQLALSVSQDRVPTGTTFAYTLQVRNTGTTMAKTLWLLDSLNPQLKMFSYASHVPAVGTSNLNWTYQIVQPQDVEEVTLQVQLNASITVGTQIPNFIAAVYTNSNGTVIGYVQSDSVVVTVAEPVSPIPYILLVVGAAGCGIFYVAYRKRRARIEEVFLISRDGLLINHLSRDLVEDKDPEVVSGMLTAVQDFVKDVFKLGENRALHEMEFGDYRILIERGDYIYLAAVTSGGSGWGTGNRLRRVLEQIETAHGETLKNWSGDVDDVLSVKELLRTQLLA